VRLTFTKRRGKHDDLRIEREGSVETVACPKQGILPHDMVHYAVESVLAHRGFLSLVKECGNAVLAARGGESEEAIERLVETFQAEMWGGRVPIAGLLAVYEHACEARGHAAVPVSAADVEAIRRRLDSLSAQWAELAIGASLAFDFPPAPISEDKG
jgi:hypothetical protein